MKIGHAYFPLLIVGALAAATYWLEFVVSHESPGRAANTSHSPDSIVHRLTLDRFDASGAHQFHLNADKLVHYADDDTAELTQPRIEFNKAGKTLKLRGNTGQGDNINRKVRLDGQVVGIRTGGADFVPQRLETETLTVLTDDEFAFTQAPVVLTQGQSRIDALGAEWNNALGTLKLGAGQADLSRHPRQSAPAPSNTKP